MSAKTALEVTAGAEPLEALQAERQELAEKIAPLWARYGDGGTWSAQRDNLYAAIALKKRMELEAKGSKITEAAVDVLVRTDEMFTKVVDRAEAERTKLFLLQSEMTSLDERFTRDTQACRFASESARFGG